MENSKKMKKMNNSNLQKNKSGQIFVISSFLILLSLYFIYSLETENTYITDFSKNIILNDIIYETCNVGYQSNGSNFDSRFNQIENFINNDCQLTNHYFCNLSIIKKATAPTNISLLTYDDYTYSLQFNSNSINYTNQFTC